MTTHATENLHEVWRAADAKMQRSMTTYHLAQQNIHKGALVALAAMILERVPDATGAEVEPSDQGDWLTLNAILTSDGGRLDYDTHGEDGMLEEVWQDMDSYCANLDDGSWSDLWRPFAAEPDPERQPPAYVLVLDLRKIIEHDGDVAKVTAEVVQ